MGSGYIAVEGHGERGAVHNLIIRLWADLNLGPMAWAEPRRFTAIHSRAAVLKLCGVIRKSPSLDALLILRDADDDMDCPKLRGPETAEWVRAEKLPFPCSVVLIRREYETLFLPCLARMAGKLLRDDVNDPVIERAGLRLDTSYEGDYERTRGVKEWLSNHFPKKKSYKPTLDQLPLTRLIDFDDLRKSELPSFGTLERALRFLDESRGKSLVYPHASE